MNAAPWNLLLIPVIFVILLCLVKVGDRIFQRGKFNLKTIWKWLKGHIVSEYTGPDECFDCNKGEAECGTCPVLIRIAMNRKD
jgi:hypothetical protein